MKYLEFIVDDHDLVDGFMPHLASLHGLEPDGLRAEHVESTDAGHRYRVAVGA